MCQYLSLRGSSFSDFTENILLSLKFIDIRESKIVSLNLRGCLHLILVIIDSNQVVLVNEGVEINTFTLPVKPPDNVQDTRNVFR